MILGVIADDFTGATDAASMLVRGGMRTVQTIGVPEGPPPEADAVVVALKSRTIAAGEAVQQSLAALRWLQAGGATHIYFKYCSTFDSTPLGNIGPVAEALMQALGTDFTIICPSFPENARTVYAGHLFVGDVLLSDSGMRDHPLTPMTDASLVRLMAAQLPAGERVGLLPYRVVAAGPQAVQEQVAALRAQGVRYAVADTLTQADLQVLAAACGDLPLLTGGSGLCMALPARYAQTGRLAPQEVAGLPAVGGHAAVLSGSCSEATRGQVADWLERGLPAWRIDVAQLALPADDARHPAVQALAWAGERLAQGPVLVYATSTPDEVRAAQQRFGVEQAGALVEACLARVARGLADLGVRRLVAAGGETSGAVVQALGVRQLRIGPSIVPGVPWTLSQEHGLLLALKSGNFGGRDFFHQALATSK